MTRSAHQRPLPVKFALATMLLAAALLLLAAPGRAAVPFKDISSSGPLQNVYLGNELSCQVRYAGDASLQFYPPSATPGDCGTFLALGGDLYAPDFSSHDTTATGSLGTRTPFTPVSQTEVSGSGTRSDPYRVTTVVDAGGTGLRISETNSYVAGEEAYRTDTTVSNSGGGAQDAVLYHAGDCYLQESDSGYGFVETDADRLSPGCALNANNNPPARIEQFVAISGGNQYYEAGYSEVWSAIGTHNPFPNTGRFGENIDNGAGVSWSINVPAGGEVTRSRFTTFSPQGRTGAPPEVVAPEEIGLPPNRRCVDRRKFSFDLRRRSGRIVQRVEVYIKRIKRSRRGLGKLKKVVTGRNIRRLVIRRLPARRFKVTIRTTHDDGSRLESFRIYRACSKSKPKTRTIRGPR